MKYDVIIVGAGPGGIYSAYELMKKCSDKKIAVFDSGYSLKKRHCPIDGEKVKACIKCKSCSIMSGFGGAGAFSDGKYNITNDFGGTLYEYIGKKAATELMQYVDDINMAHGGEGNKLVLQADVWGVSEADTERLRAYVREHCGEALVPECISCF